MICRARQFLVCPCAQNSSGAHPMDIVDSFPGVKWSEPEAGHLPPSSATIKNLCSPALCTPEISIVWFLIKWEQMYYIHIYCDGFAQASLYDRPRGAFWRLPCATVCTEHAIPHGVMLYGACAGDIRQW
jgi:hypothetical protein